MKEYMFFFVGGSCGSFVKLIFAYYLTPQDQRERTITLYVNPVSGDCHNGYIFQTHWLTQLSTEKKIIVIDFDDDDKATIAKMSFWKVVAQQIVAEPTHLKTNWNGRLANIDPSDIDLLEQTFVQNPDYLIFPDWKDQIKTLTPDLTIKFKDIMFGNLNKIISDFLNVTHCDKIDKFIEEYRAINKKYVNTVYPFTQEKLEWMKIK